MFHVSPLPLVYIFFVDPSLPIGRRKEIDSVMKKARGSNNGTGDYWDKKLLDIEEKDPNRWRHSGFKKMYLEDEDSSPDSDTGRARVRERERERVPPRSELPPHRRPRSPARSPPRDMRRRSPDIPPMRRRSPPPQMMDKRSAAPPGAMRGQRRPPSPPPKVIKQQRNHTYCD